MTNIFILTVQLFICNKLSILSHLSDEAFSCAKPFLNYFVLDKCFGCIKGHLSTIRVVMVLNQCFYCKAIRDNDALHFIDRVD